MPLMNIEPPPGMYKNGTPYSRKGRWTDGNLVRWHDGSVRPIGGWTRRQQPAGAGDVAAIVADPALEAVRDIFAWKDSENGTRIVFGSNLGLYHLSGLGVLTTVTYAGYTPNNSSKDPNTDSGYGRGLYGVGPYGVSTGETGTDPLPPDRWYTAAFGSLLLAGVRNNGGIYELDNSLLTMSLVTNAPTDVQDVCVTDQRQVMAIGGGGEPRRLQASDIENRTDWTPAVANQVIDRVVEGTGKLLRCIPVLRQVLLLGENDARVARYIGPPYVYAVELAGENCGPLAAEAVAKLDRFAVWWGDNQFWLFDGAVKALDCEVIDFLNNDASFPDASKITTFTNAAFSEVWWLYQSIGSTTGEVDSYVTWDYRLNTWHTGRLARTAGIDQGVTSTVICVDSDGVIYNHELHGVVPEGDIFIETGAYELGNGERNLAIKYIYPDADTPATVTYNLITRQLPTGDEYSFGPYTNNGNDPIATTGVLGREVKLKVNMSAAASEHGKARLDIAGRGTGRR